MTFTHIDSKNQPTMVDVGEKAMTHRTAWAQAAIDLPRSVLEYWNGTDIAGKKGSVVNTAVIAGVMGAKKTADLIPLCHPLALTNCQVEISFDEIGECLFVDCYAETHGHTGVEMEALTGVMTAALTVYDMCKALSHDIIIRDVRLMEKRGGKRDFTRRS